MTQQIQSIPYPSYTTVQRDALIGISIGFKKPQYVETTSNRGWITITYEV